MRSFIGFRFVSVVMIATILLVGFIVPVAAQEATPEATEAFTSEMMTMEGACPQNVASSRLEQMMTMQVEPTEEATEMVATEEGVEVTEEVPEVEATEEGMEATAEPVTGPSCLVGSLSGNAEVPGPGDEDGLGVAFVTFDSTTGEVCYEVAVANIELPAQAMHIHVGEAGVSGDVVIPFPTAPDAEGVAMGCTTAEDMTVLEDLAANPAGYYVNVHTSDYPDGAVRGQLAAEEAAAGEPLEVSLIEFQIDMPTSIPAGTVTFNITNNGTEEHSFEIEGNGIEQELEPHLQPGESGTLTVDLAPGTYTVYCPVEDHRPQGMALQLTVTEAE